MTEIEKKLRSNIGKKIKLARSNINYTQEKLAEKTSLSPRYISQLERGLAFGSATTIVSICNALHISSDFLFDGLVLSSNSELSDMVDKTFLDNYINLNGYNKDIIKRMSIELYELQNEYKEKREYGVQGKEEKNRNKKNTKVENTEKIAEKSSKK